MYIHVGSNIIVSDKTCVGIFNIDTLKLSEDNMWLIKNISSDDKLICLEKNNRITSTSVSPFTVLKRKSFLNEELIWSKE